MNQIRKAKKTQSLKENSNTKVYGILSQIAQELVQDQMNKSAWVGSSTKHTKNKLKYKNSKTSKELKWQRWNKEELKLKRQATHLEEPKALIPNDGISCVLLESK